MAGEKHWHKSAVSSKKGLHRKNKSSPKRLSWRENEPGGGEGGGLVVKGISRRVIVVRSPDERIFEQAIFIIREDFAGQAGVSEKDVLRQARRAADEYLRGGGSNTGRLLARLKAPLYAAAGAAATGLAWLAVQMVHL